MDYNNRHSKGMGQNTTNVHPSNRNENRNGNRSNDCCGEAWRIRMYILPCYINKCKFLTRLHTIHS